jgi:hypothetical protein
MTANVLLAKSIPLHTGRQLAAAIKITRGRRFPAAATGLGRVRIGLSRRFDILANPRARARSTRAGSQRDDRQGAKGDARRQMCGEVQCLTNDHDHAPERRLRSRDAATATAAPMATPLTKAHVATRYESTMEPPSDPSVSGTRRPARSSAPTR